MLNITNKTISLLLFLFPLCLQIVSAQEVSLYNYLWKNFNTEHGLPSSEVYCAIQDSKGYIWFGTDNGVSRFDGYGFKNYGPEQGLTDFVINTIQEDEQHRIWFSSVWGGVFIYENETIKPFSYNQLILSHRNQYRTIVNFSRISPKENKQGYILLALNTLGILKIMDDGHAELISAPTVPAFLCFDSNNGKIVIYQLFSNGKEYKKTKPTNMPIYEYDGTELQWRNTAMGVVTGLSSTYYYEDAKHKQYLFLHIESWSFSEKSQTKIWRNHNIIDIFPEGNNLWVAELTNGGLNEYDSMEAVLAQKKRNLIPNISATSILKDKQGGIWVTSLEQGIFYLKDKRISVFSKSNGQLAKDWVSSVSTDNNGNIFLGFWEGEVGVLNNKKHYKIIDKVEKDNINDIQWQNNGNALWYGCGHFLKKWTGTKIIDIKHSSGSLNACKKIIPKHSNKEGIWVLAPNHNNIVEIKQNLGISKFEESASGANKRRSFGLFEDYEGQLWAGKLDGLYRVDDKGFTKANDLPIHLDCRIEDITGFSNGTLVIGTKGRGIVIWDKQKAIQITQKDGLLSDMIEKVSIDKQGDVWVATLAGLNRLFLDKNGAWQIESITMFHGLASNEINDIAFNQEGTWVATPKGLALIQPKIKDAMVEKPSLIAFSAKGIYLDIRRPIKLSYKENDIEIEWNLFNFAMNGKIPYRYRLPSSAAWINTYNRNISLPSMTDGYYEVEIQAQNEDGIWSPSLTVPFSIAPAWYATWLFRSFILLSAAAAFFYWNNQRIKKVKEKFNTQLKINELERTALASQMNPHFIFNCLNSIQRLIQKDAKDEAMNYLGRFAKLIRLTLEATRRGQISLEDEMKIIEHYLNLEKLRFKENMIFSINIDPTIDKYETEIPPMLIQPFIENAIKHGFDGVEYAAKVNIDIKKEKEYLLVKIEDNGKGLNKEEIAILGQSMSLGNQLTRQRLALHNQSEEQENISIRPNTENGKNGTEVLIRIRLYLNQQE